MPFESGHQKIGGKVKGTLNKKNQEIFALAEELGFNPIKIKMLLAMKMFKELGYSEDEIERLSTQELIDIQDKNSNDLIPYMYGKRKPVDSQGDDSSSIISDVMDFIDASRQ